MKDALAMEIKNYMAVYSLMMLSPLKDIKFSETKLLCHIYVSYLVFMKKDSFSKNEFLCLSYDQLKTVTFT